MLVNYKGEFNPEITYLYGDVFKAKTEAGHGVFVVVSTDSQNITDNTQLISRVGDGIICLSGEFRVVVNISSGRLYFTDVVYGGVVTRTVNIYLTAATSAGLFIESNVPDMLIKCDRGISLTTSTYGYNDGIVTGVLDGGNRFRAITTNSIPNLNSYKSFYLSFTFSQKIFAGGE